MPTPFPAVLDGGLVCPLPQTVDGLSWRPEVPGTERIDCVQPDSAALRQPRFRSIQLVPLKQDREENECDDEHGRIASIVGMVVGSLVGVLRRHRVTHVVLAGEIRRRPRLGAMRLSAGLLAVVPLVVSALAHGDDGLLKVVVRGLEARGFKVVGAHQVVPELVASEGLWTRTSPQKADWRDIEAARAAAEAIGGLDIGQGAVAVGGRAIALEGIEGTDAMLERVRDLRGHGRLAGKARGVLVKCAKPGQELRADMPAVGPQTVEGAHAAGLAGIAVEAGCSLVLDGPEMIARADRLGLFMLGLPPKEKRHDG